MLKKFLLANIITFSCLFSPVAFTTSLKEQSSKSLTQEKIAKIESLSGGRIGLSVINTGNKEQIRYRAEEHFPLCSTSKVMIVAAILKESMKDSHLLQKHISYTKETITEAGYAPITEKHLEEGMSIADLCAAALQFSDNAAANLLIKELGGPASVTKFARMIGDNAFRLDRWEPHLNSAIPGDMRDTSTPAAMEKSLQELLLGKTLAPQQQLQLQDWLKGNTTGDSRIRAGVPKNWIVGDKTGTSFSYGTTNDVGIIWPPEGAPLIIAIYFTQTVKGAAQRNDIIASVTEIVVDALY